MKISFIIFALLLPPMVFAPSLYSQDDNNGGEIKMSQYEWHLKRDQYAVSVIKLLRKLEKLDSAIDSLKTINGESEKIVTTGCDNVLLALVGATKESYEDFKRKFDETEYKVKGKTGAPADARMMYFDEISISKITCLPEFSDRYKSLKKELISWEGTPHNEPEKNNEGNYVVVKGDCLWKISKAKYNTPYLWPVIWDANKMSVINSGEIYGRKFKSISNHNLIYPGQVLKIPKVTNSQRMDAKEREDKYKDSLKKSKFFRKTRKTKK